MNLNNHIKALLQSYSEIYFFKSKAIGALLLLITFINPYVALGGIVAVISAYAFARIINMSNEFLNEGFYTYNPLLTGLAIGYLFRFNELTILFMVIAGILTFILTVVMYSVFIYYLKMPVLSLPFVIVSSIAYLAATQYSNLFVTGLYPHTIYDLQITLPYWLEGYFRSFGSIFFMTDVVSGIVIALIFLAMSRIMFLLSVIGYFAGSLVVGLMYGSFEQSFADINHFNFILIAIAVGGVFLVPSLKSYLLAVIAVCTSTILLDSVLVFWSNFGIPAFTLPFNAITLSFIYLLGLIKYPQIALIIKNTPEETLDLYLTNKRRYPGSDTTVQLPFSGKWTVYQDFDGKWTHKGNWKYAYDFIITDEEGNSYKNNGDLLEDYYCYKKPVLSPVSGRVVKVVNNLKDMPIGKVDKANNWGNLIIIKDERGFFVELSHFAEDSIKVKEGDWAERSSMLGLCGNSGYSPQPHIHIQVQETEDVGSYTIPFSFINYIEDRKYYSNDLPTLDKIIEPLHVDNAYDNLMTFVLDDEMKFEVYKDSQKIDEVELKVDMEIDGTFYFDSGKGKLYFEKKDGTFYFYSTEGNDKYLNMMLQSFPRFPLAYRDNLTWNDNIPIGTITNKLKKSAALFLSSFNHNLFSVDVSSKFVSSKKIESEIASSTLGLKKKAEIVLDEFKGFSSFKMDDIELRKINNE